MLNLPYIYTKEGYPDPKQAIILLPEIFGMTKAIREVVDRFADELKILSLSLEFFYPLTGLITELPYDTGGQIGFELMHKLDSETFLLQLKETINQIELKYPTVKTITVCGFCFGGKLAYLSGLNPSVKKIISFYGSSALKPYFGREGVVQALGMVRRNDANLQVLSFYGESDGSIPTQDREEIASIMKEYGINYQFEAYLNTGHAFFNSHRPNFNQIAADDAWGKIKTFLSSGII
jgi:carboxymethylenebutenolidase